MTIGKIDDVLVKLILNGDDMPYIQNTNPVCKLWGRYRCTSTYTMFCSCQLHSTIGNSICLRNSEGLSRWKRFWLNLSDWFTSMDYQSKSTIEVCWAGLKKPITRQWEITRLGDRSSGSWPNSCNKNSLEGTSDYNSCVYCCRVGYHSQIP